MQKTVILSAVLIFTFFTGCYTVIKHPAVSDTENSEFSHEVYFADDCSQCHQGVANDFLPQNNYVNPGLNYIENNSRWNYFYDSPWWYRDMFYALPRTGNADSGDGTLPTTSARSRFPGTNGSAGNGSATRISSGSSGGTRIVGSKKEGDSEASPKTGSVRQSEKNTNVRKAVRGTGESKSKAKKSTKPKRRETK